MNNKLLIRIYSFSYPKDYPIFDPTGHGSGYIFDCRALPNPYYVEGLAHQTGMDEPVAKMLDASPEVHQFLDSAYSMVKLSADAYQKQGYSDLSIMFGCTGGRHRSVYCANQLMQRLRDDGFNARLIHWQLEQNNEQYAVKRALILAAGFGKRLRPLTNSTPKALIDVGDKSMLDWTLDRLQNIGCNEVVVNAHHHADQIHDWSERNGDTEVSLVVSDEEEILGTGGGIAKASRWLHGPTPVLVHNADIWHDFDLNQLYAKHNPDDMATLVCQERESTSYLLVDEEQRVCGLSWKGKDKIMNQPAGYLKRLGFTGIHLCSHRLLERLTDLNRFSIIDSYLKLIGEGETVRAFEMEGNWFDMGTVEKLDKLKLFLTDSKHV